MKKIFIIILALMLSLVFTSSVFAGDYRHGGEKGKHYKGPCKPDKPDKPDKPSYPTDPTLLSKGNHDGNSDDVFRFPTDRIVDNDFIKKYDEGDLVVTGFAGVAIGLGAWPIGALAIFFNFCTE